MQEYEHHLTESSTEISELEGSLRAKQAAIARLQVATQVAHHGAALSQLEGLLRAKQFTIACLQVGTQFAHHAAALSQLEGLLRAKQAVSANLGNKGRVIHRIQPGE